MARTTQPITPAEARATKADGIPDEVVRAFNKLIEKAFDGRSASVRQIAVIDAILTEMEVATPSDAVEKRRRIFAEHWLDVEDIYRRAGWDVEYDKPGFNEDCEATFKFTRARNG